MLRDDREATSRPHTVLYSTDHMCTRGVITCGVAQMSISIQGTHPSPSRVSMREQHSYMYQL